MEEYGKRRDFHFNITLDEKDIPESVSLSIRFTSVQFVCLACESIIDNMQRWKERKQKGGRSGGQERREKRRKEGK